MKLLLFFVLFSINKLTAQTSIYKIAIPGVDGKTINMSDFRGKKIFIAAVSPDNLKNGELDNLDSLQKIYPSVIFMIVPSTDFGGNKNTEIVTAIKSQDRKNLVVTAMTDVTKAKGGSQNALFRWLSNTSENIHFEADVMSDLQYYIVSESGVLYSVLEKDTPAEVITIVLNQEDVKE